MYVILNITTCHKRLTHPLIYWVCIITILTWIINVSPVLLGQLLKFKTQISSLLSLFWITLFNLYKYYTLKIYLIKGNQAIWMTMQLISKTAYHEMKHTNELKLNKSFLIFPGYAGINNVLGVLRSLFAQEH